MGKKTSRATQTSKGERRSVNKSVTKALRREYMSSCSGRVNNQITAFLNDSFVLMQKMFGSLIISL